MPTSTPTTKRLSPSSGPRKKSVSADLKAAVSLSSDFGTSARAGTHQPRSQFIGEARQRRAGRLPRPQLRRRRSDFVPQLCAGKTRRQARVREKEVERQQRCSLESYKRAHLPRRAWRALSQSAQVPRRRWPANSIHSFIWKTASWVKGKPEGPRFRIGLPTLIAAPAHKQQFIFCEGEKDVRRLAKLGFISTTVSEGAHAAWDWSSRQWFKGWPLVVVPVDADKPGRAHAEKVAKALNGVAASVRIPRSVS